MNDFQHLLNLIQVHGMVGRINMGPPIQIIGGHTMSVHAGISYFAKSFEVFRGNQGWLLRTFREGQQFTETQVSTEAEILTLLTSK